MGFLHLAVLYYKGIPLAPIIAKERGALKGETQCFGEFGVGITKESDLEWSACDRELRNAVSRRQTP